MSAIQKKRYTARICWNTNKWTFPSAVAPHLEKDTFAVGAGFGHEEWLFNFVWLIDGFHYAFLQPVSKSLASLMGKNIEVLLYTIKSVRDR